MHPQRLGPAKFDDRRSHCAHSLLIYDGNNQLSRSNTATGLLLQELALTRAVSWVKGGTGPLIGSILRIATGNNQPFSPKVLHRMT